MLKTKKFICSRAKMQILSTALLQILEGPNVLQRNFLLYSYFLGGFSCVLIYFFAFSIIMIITSFLHEQLFDFSIIPQTCLDCITINTSFPHCFAECVTMPLVGGPPASRTATPARGFPSTAPATVDAGSGRCAK